MGTFIFGDKTYSVDMEGYLSDYNDWDENFARGMAPKVGITSGLSENHWKVINFIRDFLERTGKCPLIYETCRMNRLRLRGLKQLFHAGYLRGACKLAGVTYMEGYLASGAFRLLRIDRATQEKKTFEVNIRGFLINPRQWDKMYAIYKAQEMKMPLLTDKHWQVINFLRRSFEKNNLIPIVYETCEACDIDLDELQKLFPDGYHRGAVKIAGLRAR